MKILLYTDVHWSQYSSILRRRGDKYSKRLENLIDSVNWAENLSKEQGCHMVVCLGDFFDSQAINSEEITALQDVQWNDNVDHYFLVGNHESGVSSLEYNSTKALQRDTAFSKFKVIYEPTSIDAGSGTMMYFIPYTTEENRKTVATYINELKPEFMTSINHKIVFSHNDIKGIRYGKFESKEGFDLKEIDASCDLFLNGHLHNSAFLNDRESILNLGNLTGQNFSENAYLHRHYACILDTDTLELRFFENPHAFNFYQIDIASQGDISKIHELGANSVVSFKCKSNLIEQLKKSVEGCGNILESRIVSYIENNGVVVGEVTPLSVGAVDHLKRFTEFILANMDNNTVVNDELSYINKEGY